MLPSPSRVLTELYDGHRRQASQSVKLTIVYLADTLRHTSTYAFMGPTWKRWTGQLACMEAIRNGVSTKLLIRKLEEKK
jgi:hypothetical protein